jgi:hypothetical protein
MGRLTLLRNTAPGLVSASARAGGRHCGTYKVVRAQLAPYAYKIHLATDATVDGDTQPSESETRTNYQAYQVRLK